MSWAEKKAQQEKNKLKAEKAEKIKLKESFASEFRRLNPMVVRLLNDFGSACFGKSFFFISNFKIQTHPPTRSQPFGAKWTLNGYYYEKKFNSYDSLYKVKKCYECSICIIENCGSYKLQLSDKLDLRDSIHLRDKKIIEATEKSLSDELSQLIPSVLKTVEGNII